MTEVTSRTGPPAGTEAAAVAGSSGSESDSDDPTVKAKHLPKDGSDSDSSLDPESESDSKSGSEDRWSAVEKAGALLNAHKKYPVKSTAATAGGGTHTKFADSDEEDFVGILGGPTSPAPAPSPATAPPATPHGPPEAMPLLGTPLSPELLAGFKQHCLRSVKEDTATTYANALPALFAEPAKFGLAEGADLSNKDTMSLLGTRLKTAKKDSLEKKALPAAKKLVSFVGGTVTINHNRRGAVWTEEQDERLTDLVLKHGTRADGKSYPWSAIAAEFGGGRTAKALERRYDRLHGRYESTPKAKKTYANYSPGKKKAKHSRFDGDGGAAPAAKKPKAASKAT